MRSKLSWPLIASLLTINAIVLIVILIKERTAHQLDVEILQLGIKATSRVTPARFTRTILSNDEAIIFIGGIPRSGTTLMRAMLDSHPDIRCGEETNLVPAMLNLRQMWSSRELTRFANASGITQKALDDATSAFLLELIAQHGPMAKRLCNKDPYTALSMPILTRLFPNSKHILMIRDVRATVHSMIEREVPVAGYNRTNIPQMFKIWNLQLTRMVNYCLRLGGSCMMVYYERLVQRTNDEAQRILKFLNVAWSDDVLHHEEKIGSEVKLNPNEFSTSQVKEKVNKKALTSWFGCYSDDILSRIDQLAPLLRQLGYDTASRQPNYAEFATASDDFYTDPQRNYNPFTNPM